MKNYDAIILGGGIAGASIAYELTQKKQRVLVLDSSKAGSGGSFAAGAFISPKVSKPSPYKSYLNDSFNYTTNLWASLKTLGTHNGLCKCRFCKRFVKA